MGEITESDLLSVLPFRNTIWSVGLTGKDLKEVLEFVAGRMKADPLAGSQGGFLQMSGISVLGSLLLLFH